MHSYASRLSIKNSIYTLLFLTAIAFSPKTHTTYFANALVFVENLEKEQLTKLFPSFNINLTSSHTLSKHILDIHKSVVAAITAEDILKLTLLSENPLVRRTLYFMTNNPGHSALRLAVLTKNITIVQILLEMGAYIDQPDMTITTRTALETAQHNKDHAMVTYLNTYRKIHASSIPILATHLTPLIEQARENAKLLKNANTPPDQRPATLTGQRVSRKRKDVAQDPSTHIYDSKKLCIYGIQNNDDREILEALLRFTALTDRNLCPHAIGFLADEDTRRASDHNFEALAESQNNATAAAASCSCVSYFSRKAYRH